MSFLKSKHSGWTYDLKRTPFGSGGGGFISAITDPISSALGTDGGGGGILGSLADIDPGPAIGQGLAELDKGVGSVVPGGWGTLAAIAAAIATYGASLPETEAAFMAADAANLAGQGLSQEAIAQNLVTGYGLTAEQAAAAAAAATAGVASNGVIATQALPYSETFDAYNLAQQGLSSSAIEQNLAATGLNKFLAADMASMASSGLSPQAIAQNLAYSYSPTELAGTGIESLQAQSGLSAKDALTNVNRARQIANLLNQGGSQIGKNISVKNIPTQQAWQQQAAQNFITAPQEQFGGLYQMNKNPFTFQNPMASTLATNKPATGLDVSGTQGQALNTQQQNQIYSSLLRS
jgi:hypothetical protein